MFIFMNRKFDFITFNSLHAGVIINSVIDEIIWIIVFRNFLNLLRLFTKLHKNQTATE